MSSNRRFLLAAVGVSLSTPALARESEVEPPRVDNAAIDAANATVEAPALVMEEELAARFDEYELSFLDLSSCELTTANTKGPSYDATCLAKLKP